jgi:glycerol kinase
MSGYVLALDQGTTSTRAIVFDKEQVIRGSAQEEFPQHYPASGWVEHDPEDLWRTALATMQAALAKAGLAARDIAGVGITNQRETAVVWDRRSGRAVYNAIVWQDRRTADLCARLREEGTEPLVRQRTGLLLDPYFSGTKIAWILDNVSGARQARKRGTWHSARWTRFCSGGSPVGGCMRRTPPMLPGRCCSTSIAVSGTTNCCSYSGYPRSLLPDVLDSAAEFGNTDPASPGREPLRLAGSPATSRPLRWARPASNPAW